MKKFSLLLLVMSGSCFAMTNVDLTKPLFQCNGNYVTKQSTIDQLMANCKNAKLVERVDVVSGRNASRIPGGGANITEDNSATNEEAMDKVKFNTDKGSYMICYFNNNVLSKCKVNRKKQVATKSTSAPVAASLTSAQVESK